MVLKGQRGFFLPHCTLVTRKQAFGNQMRIILFHSFKQQNPDNLQPSTNEFDGCYHVFLDVGSNLGNTVRLILISDFNNCIQRCSNEEYTVTEKW